MGVFSFQIKKMGQSTVFAHLASDSNGNAWAGEVEIMFQI